MAGALDQDAPVAAADPVLPAVAPISLAYSVDADDAFMFAALQDGAGDGNQAARIDTRGLRFTHRRADTASLNGIAASGSADVVAISTGAYPRVASDYLLLPHGASVGRGYGPVVVARQPTTLAALRGRKVGIPGLDTTAWLVLRMMEPALVPEVVPIAPFARIFEALDAGQIDAALLIHEGRLLYQERGYHRVAELGEWWLAETGLPLPLGVNVIRRGLGPELVARVSAVLGDSIRWALQNRAHLISQLAAEERGDAALARAEMLDRYLGMYANEDTASMAPDVRRAIDALFDRAQSAGLIAGATAVGWAP
jgi:1,4-dihydroxy-6-naphthoate synthase